MRFIKLHLTNFMKKEYTLILILLLLGMNFALAQSSPPPPPDGGSGPGTVDDVPINLLVYPLMILACILGYRFFTYSKK